MGEDSAFPRPLAEPQEDLGSHSPGGVKKRDIPYEPVPANSTQGIGTCAFLAI